jgi:hypothetical protein
MLTDRLDKYILAIKTFHWKPFLQKKKAYYFSTLNEAILQTNSILQGQIKEMYVLAC